LEGSASRSLEFEARTLAEDDMPKVIFILQRKAGTTPEQCLARWAGDQHIAIVSTIPGLTRWTQNHVVPATGEAPCDGIGELWFESDELLQSALGSA
jgi:uncharacterized protein (TIGR02118 family)